MIENFEQLRRNVLDAGNKSGSAGGMWLEMPEAHQAVKPVVAVANAADREVIEAVRELRRLGIAEAILTGDAAVIGTMCREMELEPLPEIADTGNETGEAAAAKAAVQLVRTGRAQVLMKGQVNSGVFLKAVLDPERGLRKQSADSAGFCGAKDAAAGKDAASKGLLCHLAAFEVPGWPKLQFHTDGGMNLFPDLEQKRQILELAVGALHRIGVSEPKVAVLSANEIVNPKVQSSVDAAQLQKWNVEGRIAGCVVEGPVAMDVALSKEAAAHKHIESRIAGETDLFLVPDIEAGNMVGKALMYCAKAKMAGVILGAACPIVMVSRADNAEAKVNSLALALACLEQ